MTIQKVRPHWGTLLTAFLVAALLGYPGGLGVAAIAFLLVLLVSAAYQVVALLGYIAGAVTPDDAEDGTDG